jgi:hypothetical protein
MWVARDKGAASVEVAITEGTKLRVEARCKVCVKCAYFGKLRMWRSAANEKRRKGGVEAGATALARAPPSRDGSFTDD